MTPESQNAICLKPVDDGHLMKKLLLRTTLGFVILLIACFGFLFMAKTSEREPRQYSPGYQTTTLHVPHRDVPLDLFVWYPTEDQMPPELIGQNALFYGHHVRQNAQSTQGSHPVVVFSHGSGGNALQVGWLAEALTEAGYVVLATNHPATTSRDSIPERTVMIWERSNDLRELLNWIENPTVDGISLDSENIATVGFSLGGHSVLSIAGLQVSKANFIDYCERNAGLWDCGWLTRGGVNFSKIDADLYEASYLDSRVSATVAVDPALTPAAVVESATTISHPVMAINFEPNEGIPEALNAAEIIQSIPNARYEIIPQSWHFSFLPECSLLGKIIIGSSGEENICSDWQTQDRIEVHRILIDQIIPFLNESLSVNGG